MKMKTVLVTYFLIAQVFLVLADQKTESKTSEVKKREDANIGDVDLVVDEKSSEAQRKRDPGYYYNRPGHSVHGRYRGRPGHRGRIITRLQSQINRPFKQYGPPNQGGPDFNSDYPTTTVSLINQEIPEPVRENSFAQESPIASQNSQPFGQHTANYLPPRNQKLPVVTPPYQFSTHEFPDNQQFQQQRFPEQNQQFQQFQQQRFPEQNQQLQIDNQNFFGQNFESQNIGQNEFGQNQQISDAALFLTQNAQAISNLYGAPATNQNYAPHNQEFEPVGQQQQGQLSQNLQVSIDNQPSRFPSQLPSYASGVLDNEETLEKIQSLEKDRIIAHLQRALSQRENSARFAHNENLAVTPSQFSSADGSFGQHSTTFLPTTANTFQGYYTTSPVPAPTTTTQAPVQAPSTPISTVGSSTVQKGGSEASSTHVGANLPAPQSFRPTLVNPAYPQYGGFVPTLVAPSGFIPSAPNFGTALYPTLIKPVETAPTHFAIPIPSLEGLKPAHPPTSTTPGAPKPPNDTPSHPSFPSHPSTPTFSIPLGPVHPPQASPPVHTPVVKPNPIPVIPATPVHPTFGLHPAATPVQPTYGLHPAATPVHPTYGLHPAATPVHPTYGLHPAATPVQPTYGFYPTVVNSGLVYKPLKVHPLYYYPGGIHRKTIATSALTYPWNYAPSYTSAKIWK